MSTTAAENKTTPKQLPPPNGDFYHFAETWMQNLIVGKAITGFSAFI
ncbi:hypothetical protein M3I54_23610 [Paraburkholderia sp. CNPSo 3274]|nr:hypothetical protein [Paraburkholderia sp. CNPSo 3274]MCP3709931.1 hypothetical protein [Paraburkholderia sp. CNPSo 3274]